MAMMKYGRTTKMTSPPDKVVKNKDGTTTTTSGNIKATFSDWIQPEKTPAPKGYISQDDYNAYEAKKKEVMDRNAAKYKPYNDAMAAYQQEQDDYKAGMEQYKRATDFYNQGPEPEKEEPGSVKISKGGKTRKGADVNFESAPRYSASQSNADLKRAMKENKNIVDINDPSISPSAKKIWMEQLGKGFQEGGTANLYGRTTGKMYVDRSAINKIKSPRDVWGEDFDSVEWEKAANSKNPDDFDRYLNKKGYQNRTFAANSNMGVYQEYVTPQMPGKPTSKMPVKPVIKEDPLPENPGKVWPDKMPTRKVLKLESTAKAKYGKLNEKIEEGDWEDPTGGKFKHKGAIQKSATHDNDAPKGFGLKGKGSSGVDLHIFTKRIKTGRLAARYAKRGDLKSLDTDPTNPDAGGVWKAGNKSKLKIYTPDLTKSGDAGAMDNYVASAEKNIEAARLYQQNERTAKSNQLSADFNKQSWKKYGEDGYIQKAEDNATNRNTIKAQMEKYKGWNRFVQ